MDARRRDFSRGRARATLFTTALGRVARTGKGDSPAPPDYAKRTRNAGRRLEREKEAERERTRRKGKTPMVSVIDVDQPQMEKAEEEIARSR